MISDLMSGEYFGDDACSKTIGIILQKSFKKKWAINCHSETHEIQQLCKLRRKLNSLYIEIAIHPAEEILCSYLLIINYHIYYNNNILLYIGITIRIRIRTEQHLSKWPAQKTIRTI